MVNDVVDLTLTKPRSRRGYLKRLRKWWAGLAVIGLLLAGFLFWPFAPRDLSVGNRLLTSQVLPAWRDGDLIVLVRHEERCDRSANTCFGAPEGLTTVGTQRAEEVGKAFKLLGLENTDIVTRNPAGSFVVPGTYRISGTIVTPRHVVVEGQLDGTALVAPSVHVASNGRLNIPTQAATVTVAGVVEKSVSARELLEVRSGGALRGDVEAGVLNIQPGGQISGARLSIGPLRAQE